MSATSPITAAEEALAAENAQLRRELELLRQKATPAEETGVAAAEMSKFSGASSSYTSELRFWYPHVDLPHAHMPCFRVMDDLGQVVEGAEDYASLMTREVAHACMATMIRVSEYDKIFLDAQRQGRIAFYLTSRGEEAAAVGSAAALQPDDWVLPQYRELGVFFWRGFTFDEVTNQLCSNEHDPAHGRQLPLHIGSKAKRIVYVKSTLGTQCPHAAGVAYGMKLRRQPQVAIAYFGEGCASEGDIPSALNIAAVHGCPTIFFCRNNGYAISTSTRDQYASDGIAPRGPAYGLPTIRVDGNDIVAVIAATLKAREIGLRERRPTLIEAMTYRVGAHSTSDDDSKYRNPVAPEAGWDSERAYWEARSPIVRLGRFMHARGWFNVTLEEELRASARTEAIASLNRAQSAGKPSTQTLFTDVYDELPWSLQEQQAATNAHMRAYPEEYAHFNVPQQERHADA